MPDDTTVKDHTGIDDAPTPCEAASATSASYNRRYGLTMQAGDSSSRERIDAFVPHAEVLIGASKAGVRVLHTDQLRAATRLLVAADVNAVPAICGDGAIGLPEFRQRRPRRAMATSA